MLKISRLERYGRPARFLFLCLIATISVVGLAQSGKDSVTVKPLMTKDVVGVPGKEAVVLTVDYLPGGASMPHRHEAQVFLYVVEGSIVTQVEGQPPVTLTAGQTFYENPTDIHKTAKNASQTEPAKVVAFIIKDKGKPVSQPVAAH
jgi:quercetin dioxygenase-like cupin family protein